MILLVEQDDRLGNITILLGQTVDVISYFGFASL